MCGTEAADGESWIWGGRWDESNWGGLLPAASWIEPACRGKRVYLDRLDGHMAFVSTAAGTVPAKCMPCLALMMRIHSLALMMRPAIIAMQCQVHVQQEAAMKVDVAQPYCEPAARPRQLH